MVICDNDCLHGLRTCTIEDLLCWMIFNSLRITAYALTNKLELLPYILFTLLIKTVIFLYGF